MKIKNTVLDDAFSRFPFFCLTEKSTLPHLERKKLSERGTLSTDLKITHTHLRIY